MRALTGNKEVNLMLGDITLENADALVNAANSRLVAGGGVDGAIHDKAGPSLRDQTEEKYPEGCPVGSAVLTMGGLLPARYVIHAVAPRWLVGDDDEEELLTSAFQRALELAADHECHSVAFPALGAGPGFDYPLPEAAKVGLRAIRDFDSPRGLPDDIRFVFHNQEDFDQYVAAVRETDGYEIDA